MAKYTIETDGNTADDIGGYLGIRIEICNKRTWVKTDMELTPYTEPDMGKVKEEAYQQGYEQGYKDGLTNGKDFQVGDEIKAVSGKAVVVYADDVKVQYVYSNGAYAFDSVGNVTKTGRHFPEIAEVLQKMKETE